MSTIFVGKRDRFSLEIVIAGNLTGRLVGQDGTKFLSENYATANGKEGKQ